MELKDKEIICNISSQGLCISKIVTSQYLKGRRLSGVAPSPTNKCFSVEDFEKFKDKDYKINDIVRNSDLKRKEVQRLFNPISKPNIMSRRTIRKIRNKVYMFVNRYKGRNSKHPFVFVTLTINKKNVQTHSELNKMLNIFLTRVRSLCKVQWRKIEYVWVNELQKNGNLHYHILFNQYLNVRTLNAFWLKILQKKGFDISDNANPVDLQNKTFLSVEKLGNYMTKYVTKDKSLIYAQRWNCSKEISRIPTHLYLKITINEFDTLKKIQRYVNKQGEFVQITPLEIEEYELFYLPFFKRTSFIRDKLAELSQIIV